MSTKQIILEQLSLGPQTSYALGVATNRPQPSVRRSVASLRKDGYDIASDGTGLEATYRLVNARPRPYRAFDDTVLETELGEF
jgi:hypothetical protein